MMLKTGLDKLDQYTQGVASGEIPVCSWVDKAVKRHYRDLKRQKTKNFPYYFEPKAVHHFVDFVQTNLCHYEGVIAGKPFLLEPWQWFVCGSIFGWLQVEEFHGQKIRRFRSADIIIPKKNGKSIMSGAIGLYMMDWDGWPGAQCYILAKNQTHAKDLGYRSAQIMVENSESLSHLYKIRYDAANAGIYCKDNQSFYKPITSKAESEDGRNVHFCGPDETKDWTNFEIYNLMKNGTVNAPNSLILSTTTAGPNQESLGHKRQKYLEKVLDEIIDDESLFGVIYTIDKQDRQDPSFWMDQQVWRKANPNFGVSVYPEALMTIANEARHSLDQRIDFETKHLNVWHSSISSFVSAEAWNACGIRKIKAPFLSFDELLDYYSGCETYIGLDMGSVDDFTALVACIRHEDQWDIIPFFFIPQGNMSDRKNAHLVKPWVEYGYIMATQGMTTNHAFTQSHIQKMAEELSVKEVVMDRYKTELIEPALEDMGLATVGIGQGYAGMAPCIDTLESMILERQINHGQNPVLKWMMGNIVIQKNPAGDRKFAKDKAEDKIDGPVALAMALYRALISTPEDDEIEGDVIH